MAATHWWAGTGLGRMPDGAGGSTVGAYYRRSQLPGCARSGPPGVYLASADRGRRDRDYPPAVRRDTHEGGARAARLGRCPAGVGRSPDSRWDTATICTGRDQFPLTATVSSDTRAPPGDTRRMAQMPGSRSMRTSAGPYPAMPFSVSVTTVSTTTDSTVVSSTGTSTVSATGTSNVSATGTSPVSAEVSMVDGGRFESGVTPRSDNPQRGGNRDIGDGDDGQNTYELSGLHQALTEVADAERGARRPRTVMAWMVSRLRGSSTTRIGSRPPVGFRCRRPPGAFMQARIRSLVR